MKNIRTQLWIMTVLFAAAFFDGMFGIGFSDAFYVLSGFAQLGILVWLWVDYNKTKTA